VLSTEIATLVPKFFDSGKGPSHDELTLYFRQTGLASADPGQQGPEGLIGKMKRVRRVLMHAVEREPEAGSRLVLLLVDSVRANGGFRAGTDDFVGEELIAAVRRGFASLGYEFDAEGHLRPATLENLHGVEMTEALWAYVRRARTGTTDSPQVVGTVKDLVEAIARHVLVETTGGYPEAMNFPGTLYQAYDRVGLTPADPKILGQLDADGRLAVEQALYLLACAVNRLRNQQGTGHGRPHASAADDLDARLSAQSSGLVGELLLATLANRQPALAGVS